MQFMFTVWMRKGGNANVPSQSSSRSVNLLIFFRELARFQVSSNMMRIGNQESAILIKVEAEDQRNQNRRKQHKRPNNQANIFFRLCVQNLVGRQIHFFSSGWKKVKFHPNNHFFRTHNTTRPQTMDKGTDFFPNIQEISQGKTIKLLTWLFFSVLAKNFVRPLCFSSRFIKISTNFRFANWKFSSWLFTIFSAIKSLHTLIYSN